MYNEPAILGHVSPDKILEPAVLDLRRKKKERLRELRSHERLNSIVRARQYRAEVDQASKAMLHSMAQQAEELRGEELRQVGICGSDSPVRAFLIHSLGHLHFDCHADHVSHHAWSCVMPNLSHMGRTNWQLQLQLACLR